MDEQENLDALLDEIQELEIGELIDKKNILLNELEHGCSKVREAEIQDELDKIYNNLDLLY